MCPNRRVTGILVLAVLGCGGGGAARDFGVETVEIQYPTDTPVLEPRAESVLEVGPLDIAPEEMVLQMEVVPDLADTSEDQAVAPDALDAIAEPLAEDDAFEDLFQAVEGDEASGEGDSPDECKSCLPCPDDGLECTKEVRDQNGECVTVVAPGFCLIAGTCRFYLEPDPSNPCRFCDPDVDQGSFVLHAGLPCDDNDPCTVSDTCDETGVCKGGEKTDCDDGNVCTDDKCLPGKGCVHTPNQAPCDDGQGVCTYQKQCSNGKCLAKKIPCKDSNPCTEDRCDPASGCVFPVTVGAACTDGNPCTVDDACTNDGKCLGSPVDCDDSNPCTFDYCDVVTGACGHLPRYGACDDHDACTINDHCEEGTKCVGYGLVCDDGNPCTDDPCLPETGCVAVPNSDPCDDGDPCTDWDRCGLGICKGVPRDCADTNPCTVDLCDPVMGCQHLPTFGPCDDGDPCTEGENCATSFCTGGTPVNCADGETCTYDMCTREAGCVHVPVDSPCNDFDMCTLGDMCKDGRCVGTPKDCDDHVPCTADACTPDGTCTHIVKPDGSPCEDDNKCLTDRQCKAAVCIGIPLSCDDKNPCTVDYCLPSTGCHHEPVTTGLCDDHSVCTQGDHCAAGECVGTTVLNCNDSNPCTDDKCDPVKGCFHQFNTAPCDDGDPCTTPDVCAQGTCTSRSVFTDPVARSSNLAIGQSGNPGQGVDVDDNPSTCAPKGQCSQGVDNAFAKVAWLFNPELLKAVDDGSAGLVIESKGQGPKGLILSLYWAAMVGPAGCNPKASGCIYRVYASDIQGECSPRWQMDNAVLEGTHLSAGGYGYSAPFYVVMGTLRLPVTLRSAKLEATVFGPVVASGSGVLGGALDRKELLDAIAAAPASGFPEPYTKEVIIQYVSKYVTPDLDVDDDGMKESFSVGMPFTLVSGKVIGFN